MAVDHVTTPALNDAQVKQNKVDWNRCSVKQRRNSKAFQKPPRLCRLMAPPASQTCRTENVYFA